jgi:hypothetical protein
MYPFNFKVQKQQDKPATGFEVQYLIAGTESRDVAAAGRGDFGSRARYLAKHRMLRTIHRLRRTFA